MHVNKRVITVKFQIKYTLLRVHDTYLTKYCVNSDRLALSLLSQKSAWKWIFVGHLEKRRKNCKIYRFLLALYISVYCHIKKLQFFSILRLNFEILRWQKI